MLACVFILLASSLQEGCCSSRHLINIQGREGGRTKGSVSRVYHFLRRQNLSQMAPLQMTFILYLVGHNCAILEPQLQSSLGKHVVLPGIRYIASLHKTRILRAWRIGAVPESGKVECLS